MNHSRKVLFLFALLMAGCGSDDSANNDPNRGTVDDLASKLQEASGGDAVQCGEVYAGDSLERDEEEIASARSCALDSYLDYQPFFVMFRQDGLNEADYVGYAFDGYSLYEGSLHYEDNPPPGLMKVTECDIVNIRDYGFPPQCVHSQ